MTHRFPIPPLALAASLGLACALAPLGPCIAQGPAILPRPSAQSLAAQAAEIRQLKRRVDALTAEVASLRRAASLPPPTVGKPGPTVVMRAVETGPQIYSLVLAEDYPQAVGEASDRLTLNPSDAEALGLKAYAMVRLGLVDPARPVIVRALTQSLLHSHARAFALVAQGALDGADGKGGEAAKEYKAAYESDHRLALPTLALADQFVKEGRKETAKRLLQLTPQTDMSPDESAALSRALAAL
jgi:hypothetical protein